MDLLTKDSKKGTGNFSYTATEGNYLQQIEIWNDSPTATLTYVVDSGLSFDILPEDVSVETFTSYKTVSITTTGPWRLIARGGK